MRPNIFKTASLASMVCVVALAAASLSGASAQSEDEVPITHQVVKWILSETGKIIRQADVIAEDLGDASIPFSAVHFLKFMNLLDSLKPIIEYMDLQEFDWVRRKAATYAKSREMLGVVFSKWLEQRVQQLGKLELRDFKKNSKRYNLEPSKEWQEVFDEIKFFMKNVTDKELLYEASKLLAELPQNEDRATYLRSQLLENHAPKNLVPVVQPSANIQLPYIHQVTGKELLNKGSKLLAELPQNENQATYRRSKSLEKHTPESLVSIVQPLVAVAA